MPLTAEVMEMLQTLHADGRGQEDHSSLANYYTKVSGTKIGKCMKDESAELYQRETKVLPNLASMIKTVQEIQVDT